MGSENILAIVTRDENTAKAVRKAVTGKVVRLEWRQFDRLDAFAHAPGVGQTAAAIVDIDNQPDVMLMELDALSQRHPSIRFIVLASELKSDLLLKAMQAGARHFVVKKQIEAELPGAIDRLALRGSSLQGHGTVITVLSVGGGCGATTIAINLAQELSDIESSPSLIVDLDSNFGGVAGTLGVKADYGIADVLATEERLDSTLVRSSAVSLNNNLNILASPATVNYADPRAINQANFRQAAKAFSEAFEFTVIDAANVSLNAAKSLAAHSSHTLIVFELNVEQMRRARTLTNALFPKGSKNNTVLPVVNRYRSRRACASVDEARKALNTPSIWMINNDYRAVTAGINQGRPLAFAAPRSPLRKDIRSLAESIHATTLQALQSENAAA